MKQKKESVIAAFVCDPSWIYIIVSVGFTTCVFIALTRIICNFYKDLSLFAIFMTMTKATAKLRF